jgi:hypothetical protein
MMRYLCLVHAEPATMAALSPEEGVRLTDESLNYDAELVTSGHMIAAEALEPPESAVTIRVRHGKVSSTDGPFAETKEHLAGFILIEARDFNDAIRVATAIPMARFGSIEVRPIRPLEHGGSAAR